MCFSVFDPCQQHLKIDPYWVLEPEVSSGHGMFSKEAEQSKKQKQNSGFSRSISHTRLSDTCFVTQRWTQYLAEVESVGWFSIEPASNL
jgi:hypothetical protein